MSKNHEEEDSVFATIVKDKNDAIAMIAYCFYKLEKIEYFKQNADLTDDAQKHRICRLLAEGERLNRIRRDAEEMLRTAVDAAVSSTVKRIEPKSFRQAIWEGIVSGLLTLLVAPLMWLGIYLLLLKMDVWPAFAAWVNSMHTAQ